ncbi:GGDEF domain-containing protein [Aquibacillus salsiterrae]|uniref:GGDEF domain-containing protein n=1 Tax=Aquibacillus salsiterrae TaxID=2950439 RepID=A0A9X3WDG9_9BACI|nr:GGDEF domain-containing protein [Aquibacillus salsiterrae]MDC3416998.1 GGDEF domain-containing protein [Aquibacillus salsiterrae]
MTNDQVMPSSNPLLHELVEVIPQVVQDHLDEMKQVRMFKLYMKYSPSYPKELLHTFQNHCHALFYSQEKYEQFITTSNQQGFKLGAMFAENSHVTLDLMLKITHSTRMWSIRHLLRTLDFSNHNQQIPLLIERFYELTNTRQHAFFEGYMDKQNEKLTHQSITDPLTGLYNRRYFYQLIVEEMIKAHRIGYPLTLMIIDLNNFKSINDSFGHMEGDKLLEEFSSILNNVRSNFDSAFRFGGDEFILILPNCTEENAKEIALRLDNQIKTYQPLVSLSFGVAEITLVKQIDKVNVDYFIRLADERMYKYKKNYKEWFNNLK